MIYWRRAVVDIASANDDSLAMGLLSGELWAGANCVRFESDFTFDTFPKIE